MAVLRLKYKRNGKVKKIKRWYLDFTDHNGISRRMPGYLDKSATIRLESKIKELAGAIREDLPIKVSELRRYFAENADTKIRNSLSKFGLLEATAAPKSMDDYIAGFKESIPIPKTGRDYTQADLTVYRVRKIMSDCGFDTWDDVSEDKINLYLHELDCTKQTRKFYVMAFRRFGRWMVKNGHAQTVPELKSVKVPKQPQRWFEKAEYLKLLETVKTGPTIYGMTGEQRYLCYWTAVETGYRVGELKELTTTNFDFKQGKVYLSGEHTKNDNLAAQNITPELSSLLKEYCLNLEPGQHLFDLPHKTAEMIQADCRAARIPEYKMPYGRIKFHSLRHTCASFYLAATGGNMQVVCEIMRHSNVTITVNRYGHMLEGARESAVEKMARYSVPQTKTDKAIA